MHVSAVIKADHESPIGSDLGAGSRGDSPSPPMDGRVLTTSTPRPRRQRTARRQPRCPLHSARSTGGAVTVTARPDTWTVGKPASETMDKITVVGNVNQVFRK